MMPPDDVVARAFIRQAQLAEQVSKNHGSGAVRTIISSSAFMIWDRWLQDDQEAYKLTDGKPHLKRIWGTETLVVISDQYFAYSYPIPCEGVGMK